LLLLVVVVVVVVVVIVFVTDVTQSESLRLGQSLHYEVELPKSLSDNYAYGLCPQID
jgi:hypothetical protein